MDSKKEVVYQKWAESERGWGVRPDGHSLHLSESDREQFIADYWASMPRRAPDEFSFPLDGSQRRLVASELYLKVLKAKEEGRFGIWGVGWTKES